MHTVLHVLADNADTCTITDNVNNDNDNADNVGTLCRL